MRHKASKNTSTVKVSLAWLVVYLFMLQALTSFRGFLLLVFARREKLSG